MQDPKDGPVPADGDGARLVPATGGDSLEPVEERAVEEALGAEEQALGAEEQALGAEDRDGTDGAAENAEIELIEQAVEDDVAAADGYVGADQRSPASDEHRLGDFTTDHTVWRLVALALVVGALSAIVGLGLLDGISFVTNGVYYGRLSVDLVSPRLNHLGWWAILIPTGGGLIVGLMAYYGSERIRGHGIPEAMETILVGGSKMRPRLLILKPLSSIISIGTGGPFGAEGPIILTGGAVGSVFAQTFRLSASERRVLLVAGACAGMAAIFGTPVAATIFGVELLLFEFRPRSLVPTAIAVVVAQVIRNALTGAGLMPSSPLFPVHWSVPFGSAQVGGSVVVGLASGGFAWVLTKAVYGSEDFFRRLPIHWAWWPAIGGVVVGLAGIADPRVLGVGYDTISTELAGRLAVVALLLLLVLKLAAWSVALGSGTSGGVLAPLLMMGAAVGGCVGSLLPGGSPGEWAVIGMCATLAAAARVPITSVVFGLEITGAEASLLPVLAACATAYLISVLVLKRSILTEKIARRGFHVVHELEVDPLAAVFVREVVSGDVLTASLDEPAAALLRLMSRREWRHQRLVPVLDGGRMVGIVTRFDLVLATAMGEASASASGDAPLVEDLVRPATVVAHPDETLRACAERMASDLVTAMPVVERDDPTHLLGVLSDFDVLLGRARQLAEERERERPLRIRLARPHWSVGARPGAGRQRERPPVFVPRSGG